MFALLPGGCWSGALLKNSKQKSLLLLLRSPASSPSASPYLDSFRKEERFVVGHMYGAIKRSLCEHHFDGFKAFHDGLRELTSEVTDANSEIKAPLFTVFPCSPFKIQDERWKFWRRWLMSEDGEPIRDLCVPWCDYAINSIRSCNAYEVASTIVTFMDDSDSVDSGVTPANGDVDVHVPAGPEGL